MNIFNIMMLIKYILIFEIVNVNKLYIIFY